MRRAVRLGSAACAVAAARVGLACLPLPELVKRLGVELGRARGAASDAADWADIPPATAELVASVDAILARWPAPSPCLVRALACGFLLRKHKPTLCIGVREAASGSRWAAHAWLEVGASALPEPRRRPLSIAGLRRLGRL